MESVETRLNEVARIAVRLEQETGCPVRLMIAQWAIESAWGGKAGRTPEVLRYQEGRPPYKMLHSPDARSYQRQARHREPRVRRLRHTRRFLSRLCLADHQSRTVPCSVGSV